MAKSWGKAAATAVFPAQLVARPGFRNVDFDAYGGEIVALMGVEGSGARELLRSFAGLERTHRLDLARRHDRCRRCGACAPMCRPPARKASIPTSPSATICFVRLGTPEIAWRGLALKRGRMKRWRKTLCKRFLVKTGSTLQPMVAVGRQPAEAAIAQALLCSPKPCCSKSRPAASTSTRRARYIGCCANMQRREMTVVMFCTEVLEIFEIADTAYVVADGQLSSPLAIADYEHIEQLATDITRLEAHRRASHAAAE